MRELPLPFQIHIQPRSDSVEFSIFHSFTQHLFSFLAFAPAIIPTNSIKCIPYLSHLIVLYAYAVHVNVIFSYSNNPIIFCFSFLLYNIIWIDCSFVSLYFLQFFFFISAFAHQCLYLLYVTYVIICIYNLW